MEPYAKVVADSISAESGDRLTTMEVRFHRFVLAEFNTHRMFSRNSASSRAIPVEKQLRRLTDDPAFPIEWPCEQPGMQGGTALEDDDLDRAQALFASVYDYTVAAVKEYLGETEEWFGPDPDNIKAHRLHKSLLNRLLEPFMAHTVIVSSTEWENFFRLRCSPLAQPEIRVPAEMMKAAYDASRPQRMELGRYHMPYITFEDHSWAATKVPDRIEDLAERVLFGEELLKKISVARCARVSALTHDGKRDPEEDIAFFGRLIAARPPHESPMEHVATPNPDNKTEVEVEWGPWYERTKKTVIVPRVGNFLGWDQLRHKYAYEED